MIKDKVTVRVIKGKIKVCGKTRVKLLTVVLQFRNKVFSSLALRPPSQSPQRSTLIFKVKHDVRKCNSIKILSYAPALSVSVMEVVIDWHLKMTDTYFK